MRQPPCPYFGECAGCDLQNLEYSEQLERKKHELARLISSKIKPDQIAVHHGPEFGYRNRMEFLFTKDGIGLRSRESPNKTIKIDECRICVPKINSLLTDLNSFFSDNDFFSPQKSQTTQSPGTQSRGAQGALRYAVIRATTQSDSISFVLNERSPGLKDAVEKIKAYSLTSPAKNILITYTNPDEDEQSSSEFFIVKGEAVLKETILGKEFMFSSQGFFQNNTIVAEKMHEYVQSLLKKYDTRTTSLLDLYAGVGTFGIINSSLFSQVFIVESFPGCTQSAEENLKLNTIKNAKIYTIEAHSIGRLKINGSCYIITDPPRSGMVEKAIEQIKRLKPKAIIYISCNPHQLAKDIPKFKSYTLESIAIFDLFPQTRHFEAVAELVLK
jgi:23S rRNA (uracil1939-C5)-methyltransferase